jgi:hypothetical protein
MSKQTKVVSFRLLAEDIRELEKFKRSLAPTHGKVTNAVAFRIGLRKLNAEQEQK